MAEGRANRCGNVQLTSSSSRSSTEASPARASKMELLSETTPSSREGGYDLRPIGSPIEGLPANDKVIVDVAPASDHSTATLEVEELRARVQQLEAEILTLKDGDGKENVLMQQYLRQGAYATLRGRMPWLVVLLIIQSSAAIVMDSFEELLQKQIVIAFFVPMIVGTGGNAGNQPGVAVTRALGLGGVSQKVLWRIARKEFLLGLITASILACVSFGRVMISYPENPKAAAAISLAVFLMVNMAITLGVGFSILMDRVDIDPANGAAPMLTTLTDLAGITILCGLAYAFFHNEL